MTTGVTKNIFYRDIRWHA